MLKKELDPRAFVVPVGVAFMIDKPLFLRLEERGADVGVQYPPFVEEGQEPREVRGVWIGGALCEGGHLLRIDRVLVRRGGEDEACAVLSGVIGQSEERVGGGGELRLRQII